MKYELNKAQIPTHVAIIMDGNGRWATQRGLPRTAGHVEGVANVKHITEVCSNLGVKYLTLYTASFVRRKRNLPRFQKKKLPHWRKHLLTA